MIVYRLSNKEYKDDISGNGAAINGSRWNSRGIRMLYSSEFISLCILESLVHLRQNYIPANQYLLKIELPQVDRFPEISIKKIDQNWNKEVAYTQWMGDQFIKNNAALVLKVPSAIVAEEHNFLINPLHADYKKVKIVNSELLELDKRLLQTQ
ncbi:MAG: superfamily protein [Chitinophagaceae bacterium]|nr:superfamily protein [Chitinophagaceae bacterium]MDB5222916.1 superfamily protein [Chitinophagaceae bacterium]